MYSLDHMLDQIKEDHIHAKQLAEGINNINGCTLKLIGVLLSQLAPIYEKNYK